MLAAPSRGPAGEPSEVGRGFRFLLECRLVTVARRAVQKWYGSGFPRRSSGKRCDIRHLVYGTRCHQPLRQFSDFPRVKRWRICGR